MRQQLHAYAARGALRQFEEQPGRGGRIEFRFKWLLDRDFTLVLDPAKSTLEFRDLLPGVPARSHLDSSIREFVVARSDRALPPHRRVDPAKLEIACVNRKTTIGILFAVKRNQYSYAIPKLLNFCIELFGFLEMRHVQYMWERMGVPAE